jgi:hypothetical protein
MLLAICETKALRPNKTAFMNHSKGDPGGFAACNLQVNPLSYRSEIVLLSASYG